MCRRGTEEAFRSLLDRHYIYILRFCWRMMGSRDEALDLTQEVFTRMLVSLPKLDPQPSLRPWLRRVALNLCLNALESRGRDPTLGRMEEANGDDQDVTGSIARDSVVETIVARDRLHHVAAAVKSLSVMQRAVVILKAVDGLSNERIGQLLELPEGTVKSHLSRARDRLRQAVSEGE